MAANRESIIQPHSFTPSINNCDVACFSLLEDCVQPTVCVCLSVCVSVHLQPVWVA